MLFLGVIFLFGYKFKQEHNFGVRILRRLRFFPRPHYLLCLFLFLFIMVLMIPSE